MTTRPRVTVTKMITEPTAGRIQNPDGTWRRPTETHWVGEGVRRTRIQDYEPCDAPRTVPYRLRRAHGILDGRITTDIADCEPTVLPLSSNGLRIVIEGLLAVRNLGGPGANAANDLLLQLNVHER